MFPPVDGVNHSAKYKIYHHGVAAQSLFYFVFSVQRSFTLCHTSLAVNFKQRVAHKNQLTCNDVANL